MLINDGYSPNFKRIHARKFADGKIPRRLDTSEEEMAQYLKNYRPVEPNSLQSLPLNAHISFVFKRDHSLVRDAVIQRHDVSRNGRYITRVAIFGPSIPVSGAHSRAVLRSRPSSVFCIGANDIEKLRILDETNFDDRWAKMEASHAALRDQVLTLTKQNEDLMRQVAELRKFANHVTLFLKKPPARA